jgi:hypothetical protein
VAERPASGIYACRDFRPGDALITDARFAPS